MFFWGYRDIFVFSECYRMAKVGVCTSVCLEPTGLGEFLQTPRWGWAVNHQRPSFWKWHPGHLGLWTPKSLRLVDVHCQRCYCRSRVLTHPHLEQTGQEIWYLIQNRRLEAFTVHPPVIKDGNGKWTIYIYAIFLLRPPFSSGIFQPAMFDYNRVQIHGLLYPRFE